MDRKTQALNYAFYSAKASANVRVHSVEQALRYTVVAVRNSVEADILQQQGFKHGKNLVLTSGYIEAWQLLREGLADITYANELIGDTIHTSLGETLSPFVKQPFSGIRSALYVAASKTTDAEILSRLSQALVEVKKDGTFEKIIGMHQSGPYR